MRLTGKIILILFFASYSWGQYLVSVRAGLINYAEGDVYIDTEPLQFRTNLLQELMKGQSLQTASGKVELQLGPAASLWMGENGSLQMVNPSLTDTQLRIEQGSIFIEVNEKHKHNKINIQLGQSFIELKDIGVYRLDSAPPHLYVFNGKAEVRKNQKKETVKQGKFTDLDSNLKILKFDRDWKDPLHDWAIHRSYLIYGKLKLARKMEAIGRQMAGWKQRRDLEYFAQQRIREQQQQQLQEDAQQQMQQQSQGR